MTMDKFCLISRIEAKATIKTNMHSVGLKLDNFPWAKQTSYGSVLRYAISANEFNDRAYVLELAADRITLIISASYSPTYLIKEALLRLISICLILSEDYLIDPSGLFQHMTIALNNSNIPQPSPDNIRPNFNRAADIILSKRIIDLSNLTKALESDLRNTRMKLIDAVSRLLVCKYSAGFKIKSASTELCIAENLLGEAIDHLKISGYRVLAGREGLIEIVRL